MKKDYANKTFQNTLFRKKKRRGGYGSKKIFSLLAILSMLAFYIIVFTDTFHIKNIKITGTQLIDSKQMQNTVQSAVKQKNIVFLNTSEIKEEISKVYSLAGIQVKKKFPNNLLVEIQENKPIYLWIENNITYLIDEGGRVIMPLQELQEEKKEYQDYNILRHNDIYKNLPTIYNSKTSISNKTLNEKHLNLIKNFILISQNKKNLQINHYETDFDTMSIAISLADGSKVYMNLEKDIENQFKRLKLIMDNITKIGNILDYIDLRYEDKVFYK